MKYREDLTKEEQPKTQSPTNYLEKFVSETLHEFEILKEIWESERKF